MKLPSDIRSYIEAHEKESLDLLLELAVIPAFSGREEQRAAFCKKWLEEQGAQGVYIDEALNVVYPVGCEDGKDMVVFMAHSDVVFPDTAPLALQVQNGKIFCPGIGDDSANAAALLTVAKYIAQRGLAPREKGVLLVINAGEEGLGNLKGCKAIMARYGARVKEFWTFDSMHKGFAVNRAVGSMRYRSRCRPRAGTPITLLGGKAPLRTWQS